MNTSYLFLATGFEEIEALATVDVMRRAGMDIKTVSITGDKTVRGAHGIAVEADALFEETDFITPEWLICPGGMPGATNLAQFKPLSTLLKAQAISGKVAAICASPAVVLAPLGILDGLEATCYPGMEAGLDKAIYRDVPVVALDRIITGNGPASTLRFALAIVANSMGDAIAQEVGSGLLYYQKDVKLYY